MVYQPIENYGIIRDMHSVALVGMDGSIDWLCFPHFDSRVSSQRSSTTERVDASRSPQSRSASPAGRFTGQTSMCWSPGSS
jgi:GH15 family glucan-1,4-alpha-glucosidase